MSTKRKFTCKIVPIPSTTEILLFSEGNIAILAIDLQNKKFWKNYKKIRVTIGTDIYIHIYIAMGIEFDVTPEGIVLINKIQKHYLDKYSIDQIEFTRHHDLTPYEWYALNKIIVERNLVLFPDWEGRLLAQSEKDPLPDYMARICK